MLSSYSHGRLKDAARGVADAAKKFRDVSEACDHDPGSADGAVLHNVGRALKRRVGDSPSECEANYDAPFLQDPGADVVDDDNSVDDSGEDVSDVPQNESVMANDGEDADEPVGGPSGTGGSDLTDEDATEGDVDPMVGLADGKGAGKYGIGPGTETLGKMLEKMARRGASREALEEAAVRFFERKKREMAGDPRLTRRIMRKERRESGKLVLDCGLTPLRESSGVNTLGMDLRSRGRVELKRGNTLRIRCF